MVCGFKYDRCGEFEDGLALVSVNNKYGFVNEEGDEVIPLMYDYAYGFCEGYAVVCLNGKYGAIDKYNRVIIPIQYDGIQEFCDGLIAVSQDGKWYFLDKNGETAIPQGFDDSQGFSDGLAAVKIGGLWGYINKQGEIVIEPLFYDVYYDSSSKLIEVCVNGKWGYIDRNGNGVLPIVYDRVSGFSNTLCAVKLDGKWGYVDIYNRIEVPFVYDQAESFSNGIAGAKFKSCNDFLKSMGGLAGVRRNNRWGFIDMLGEEIIPPQYDYISSFNDGLAMVSLDGKCGFVDKFNDVVIPVEYDFALPFCEGYAVVKKGFKWGFIDKEGNEVVPLQYDYAYEFHNGFARVMIDEKWGYIKRENFELLTINETIELIMCRKIYIPTIEEYLAERAIKQSVVQSGKLTLLFSGQKVAIIPTGRYEDTHPRNTLCRGLILNRDGCEPFTAELNGCKIPLNSITIRHTPKEYAIHADWLKSNSLDWNSSIVHYGCYGNTTQYECKIDVDSEFDLAKLEYNCLYPISVRIGNKEYRYNKPILVSVSYNGKIYQVCHKTRTTNNTQDVEESK